MPAKKGSQKRINRLLPKRLRKVAKKYDGCTRCPLYQSAHHYVWFRGSAPCDVLFIGEAPGNNEDLWGEPFIGNAGQLLDLWIADAQETVDFSYGITNVVCCRPLDDNGGIRPPHPTEYEACFPRLKATIKACKPQVLIMLGGVAYHSHKIWTGLVERHMLGLKHPAYIARLGGYNTLDSAEQVAALTAFLEENLDG